MSEEFECICGIGTDQVSEEFVKREKEFGLSRKNVLVS